MSHFRTGVGTRVVFVLLLAMLECRCVNRRNEPLRRAGHAPVQHDPKPGTKPVDAGSVTHVGSGSGGNNALHATDAGEPPAMPAINDAAAMDASIADAHTSPSACDPKKCPDPSATGVQSVISPWVACCTREGACGAIMEYNLGEASELCEPWMPGEPDATCLDIVYHGTRAQGCCRPDGTCGHLDPVAGCHQLFNNAWSDTLKHCGAVPGLTPAPANPFSCISDESACTQEWECCLHYNYDTRCSDPDGRGNTYCNHCPEC